MKEDYYNSMENYDNSEDDNNSYDEHFRDETEDNLEGGAYSLYPYDFPLEEMGMGMKKGGVIYGGFGPTKWSTFMKKTNDQRRKDKLKPLTMKQLAPLYEKYKKSLKKKQVKKPMKKNIAKQSKKMTNLQLHSKCLEEGKYYNKKTGRCNQKKPKDDFLLPVTLKAHYDDKKYICESQGKVFNKKTKRCNKKIEDIIKKAADDIIKETLLVKKKTMM